MALNSLLCILNCPLIIIWSGDVWKPKKRKIERNRRNWEGKTLSGFVFIHNIKSSSFGEIQKLY